MNLNFQKTFAPLLAFLALAACDAHVDQSLLSTSPASANQFAFAKGAASTCGQVAPAWQLAEDIFKNEGYIETQDARLLAAQRHFGSVILEKPGTDVTVLIGSRGGEGACIVGLKGMTPEQSVQLARPWVQKFRLLTNEERGQGLAKNAQQAWGRIEETRIVYVAAYKTWNVLEVPGAAVRLLYIQK